MSRFCLLFAGTTPIGGFSTGTAATYIGVPKTPIIEALICAVGAIIGIRYYYRQRAEIPNEPAPTLAARLS